MDGAAAVDALEAAGKIWEQEGPVLSYPIGVHIYRILNITDSQKRKTKPVLVIGLLPDPLEL